MGSKVWTAGNLYVNQSGKIVQLMAVARQEGSAQELAIYQEMHAPLPYGQNLCQLLRRLIIRWQKC